MRSDAGLARAPEGVRAHAGRSRGDPRPPPGVAKTISGMHSACVFDARPSGDVQWRNGKQCCGRSERLDESKPCEIGPEGEHTTSVAIVPAREGIFVGRSLTARCPTGEDITAESPVLGGQPSDHL